MGTRVRLRCDSQRSYPQAGYLPAALPGIFCIFLRRLRRRGVRRLGCAASAPDPRVYGSRSSTPADPCEGLAELVLRRAGHSVTDHSDRNGPHSAERHGASHPISAAPGSGHGRYAARSFHERANGPAPGRTSPAATGHSKPPDRATPHRPRADSDGGIRSRGVLHPGHARTARARHRPVAGRRERDHPRTWSLGVTAG